MNTPIYAKLESEVLCKEVESIKELLREVERKTAFLSTKSPMLFAVPAPESDCIRIGKIVVCGVSMLNDEQRSRLTSLLEGYVSINHQSGESGSQD